jgi:hypothetical protein
VLFLPGAPDLSLIQELCAEVGLARGSDDAAAPPVKRRRLANAVAEAAAAAAAAADAVTPSLAYVLVYELLFGAGCEPSGEAEQAVCAAEPALRRALQARLKQARVACVRACACKLGWLCLSAHNRQRVLLRC